MTDALVDAFFLQSVSEEVERARKQFPHNQFRMTALTEEVGELAKALLEREHQTLLGDSIPSIASLDKDVWDEAVQVAAMALRVATEGDVAHRYEHPDFSTLITLQSQTLADASAILQDIHESDVRVLAARCKLGEGLLLDLRAELVPMTYNIASQIMAVVHRETDLKLRNKLQEAADGGSMHVLADMAGVDVSVCWEAYHSGEIAAFLRQQLMPILD